MTVVFAEEKLADAYRDAIALTELHYAEIAPYPDLFKLNPDLDAYDKMEKAGVLKVITARDDGALVGYFLLMMRAHPHYRDVKTAVEDMKFLHPSYRTGYTGVRMIQYAEHVAKAAGCKVILQRSKAKSGHGALYARLGYDLMDEVYSKRLDREDADGN